MVNYNIGIQLTKNSDKYFKLASSLDIKKNIKCFNLSNEKILKKQLPILDILVTHRITPKHFSYANNNLKWIHFGAAGIENSLFSEILKSKTIITNSSGIHAEPVAEFVMGNLLYFSKQFFECEQYRNNREWTQWNIARKMKNLNGKTIGIIGYGSIGKEIAKKARAFNMRIIATKRLQKKIENKKTVDYLIPTSEINFLLKESDYIIICCPLTPLTKGMIGNKELNKMKKTSYIVNIARGSIIDENSLVDALKNNNIAGAALDVFETEPLPKDNPLFKLDNVFLSPHISGNFPNYNVKVMKLFENNFDRFIKGKTLINRVCKKRLY